MKRDEVLKVFPEATDEQVDALLNAIGGELNPLKGQNTKLSNQLGEANQGLQEAQAARAAAEAQLAEVSAQLEGRLTEEERVAARERAAEEKERAFALKSAELEARAVFVAAGFAPEDVDALLPRVVSEDAEAAKAAAQALVDFDSRRRKAAEDAAKDALLKGNPGNQGSEGQGTMTREQFKAMSYSEQLKFKGEHPEAFAQL